MIAPGKKEQTTESEKLLWYYLKNRKLDNFRFRRQVAIGNYIVDFFIATKRIVIEIDGIQHQILDHWQTDKIRDAELQQLGITVLRYSNRDVNDNFRTVCADILKHLNLQFSDLRKNQ